MNRFWKLFGYGLVGSLVFYLGGLLFGGTTDTAFTSSAIGFWLAVAIGFFSTRNRYIDGT